MDCCSASNDDLDFGFITAGSRWSMDVELPDVETPPGAYDLTGLKARLRIRRSSFDGEILLDLNTVDHAESLSIPSPATDGIIAVDLTSAQSADFPVGARLHVEVDVVDPADDPPDPLLTQSGFLRVKGKSIVPSAS